jgi:hypothetical protein
MDADDRIEIIPIDANTTSGHVREYLHIFIQMARFPQRDYISAGNGNIIHAVTSNCSKLRSISSLTEEMSGHHFNGFAIAFMLVNDFSSCARSELSSASRNHRFRLRHILAHSSSSLRAHR